MNTIVATATASGSTDAVVASLVPALEAQLESRAAALWLVFASTSQPLGELLPKLRERARGAVVLGASTSGEFTEAGDTQGACAVLALAGDFVVRAGLGAGLGADPEGAVTQSLAGLPESVEGYAHRTALLLLDALSGTGEEATLIAAGMLGSDARLAGGAAGDALAMKATWVGVDDRVARDALALAVVFSKKPLGVGVCVGNKPLSEGVKVTRAVANRVYELDGRPAWDMWVERTQSAARAAGIEPAALTGDAVGAFLLRYEAGLANGDEYKIRAPLARHDDGSLTFACGIPEGVVLRITESEPARQVESARVAAQRALAQTGGGKPAGAVVFDCICRKLILGERFGDAVRGISEQLGGVKLAGFETYGEIALDAGDMSGFHNTTTVVLTFPS